jgi:hypothetical protein
LVGLGRGRHLWGLRGLARWAWHVGWLSPSHVAARGHAGLGPVAHWDGIKLGPGMLLAKCVGAARSGLAGLCSACTPVAVLQVVKGQCPLLDVSLPVWM